MSYDKFTMYLAAIPDFNTDDEEKSSSTKAPEATGSFNLFDMDQR